MVQRLTYRRRHAYNTRSNKVKVVKTPGGTLTFHYLTKTVRRRVCGVVNCNVPIHGVPRLRSLALSRTSKKDRTVSRAYGGSICGKCVRDKIVRAFLIEEQKVVKKIVKQNEARNKKQEKVQIDANAKAAQQLKEIKAAKDAARDATRKKAAEARAAAGEVAKDSKDGKDGRKGGRGGKQQDRSGRPSSKTTKGKRADAKQ